VACITEERRPCEQEEAVFALVCSDDAATLQRQETELAPALLSPRWIGDLSAMGGARCSRLCIAEGKQHHAPFDVVADGPVATGTVPTVQPVDCTQSNVHNSTVQRSEQTATP